MFEAVKKKNDQASSTLIAFDVVQMTLQNPPGPSNSQP